MKLALFACLAGSLALGCGDGDKADDDDDWGEEADSTDDWGTTGPGYGGGTGDVDHIRLVPLAVGLRRG